MTTELFGVRVLIISYDDILRIRDNYSHCTVTWIRMILLPSFLVCAEMLYCYTAVYNSPLFAAKVVEFANHYFFAWAG